MYILECESLDIGGERDIYGGSGLERMEER